MLQNCASECVNNRKYRTLQDACDEGAPCALEVADTCSCYNFLCVDVPSDKIFLRKRACMHPSFNEHGAVIGRRQTQRHAECGPGRRGAPPPSRPAGRRERARRRRGWAATPADDGGHPARGWERPAPGPAGTRRWGVSWQQRRPRAPRRSRHRRGAVVRCRRARGAVDVAAGGGRAVVAVAPAARRLHRRASGATAVAVAGAAAAAVTRRRRAARRGGTVGRPPDAVGRGRLRRRCGGAHVAAGTLRGGRVWCGGRVGMRGGVVVSVGRTAPRGTKPVRRTRVATRVLYQEGRAVAEAASSASSGCAPYSPCPPPLGSRKKKVMVAWSIGSRARPRGCIEKRRAGKRKMRWSAAPPPRVRPRARPARPAAVATRKAHARRGAGRPKTTSEVEINGKKARIRSRRQQA